MNKNHFETKLTQLISKENILRSEPLSKHTTFRIGGPADYIIFPSTILELQNILSLCRKEQIDYYIIGNGSNLLVGDYGYQGVIIKICKNLSYLRWEERESKLFVQAGAGILLSKFAMEISKLGYKGLEFAVGIPGTLGGGITMNAGAYGSEIKDFIQSVTVISSGGTQMTFQKEELEFEYRTSRIQKENLIVTEATFLLEKGEKGQITEKVTELNKQRREKQPLEYYSAGSTFKRPPNNFAGKLIMEAGLRGYRIGDIMVSDKHCGFVVNVGNGTAKEVCEVMKHIVSEVNRQFGVQLEPEVRFLGIFERGIEE